MARPRSGTLTLAGRYFEIGSVSAISPRCTASVSKSDVNTLLIEPISKSVSPLSGIGAFVDARP